MARTLDELRGITRDNPPANPVTVATEPQSQSTTDAHKDSKTLSLKRFSEKVRDKVVPAAKKAVAVTALTAATLSPMEQAVASPNISANTSIEINDALQRRQKLIDAITRARSSELSAEIVDNLTNLQDKIRPLSQSNDKTKKYPVVKKLLASVYTHGGLSGDHHYCVAGAMLAHRLCANPIMHKILPDPEKTPKEFAAEYNTEFSSHPNVSCPALQQYFRASYGGNYAGPKDPNFKEVLQNLEAGDILTLYQESNSSSGHHCVTCIGPVENGIVQVKSLNGESTYPVNVSRISGAACVMKQFRETYARELTNELPLDNFLPIRAVSEKASLVSAPMLKEQKPDPKALSFAQEYRSYMLNQRRGGRM